VTLCFFASDLHGHPERYEKLWNAVKESTPDAVFLGGDLLPSGLMGLVSLDPAHQDFVNDFLAPGFGKLRTQLGKRYPEVFLILGNDDGRFEEAAFLDVAATGLWTYAHNRRCPWSQYDVYGYAYVPPTPFMLKDWERYDVSRFVPPGCVSLEDGQRSISIPANEIRFSTIKKDLETLTGERSLEHAVFLFHGPPFETTLDRVANDGKMIDYVPLDLNVGSIALRRFIEQRQPLLTLHGHIHESVRLTGSWRDRIGRTHAFGAAHDGAELSLVRFEMEDLAGATRELL
jgi:Icc-related predicted phosphoesterase